MREHYFFILYTKRKITILILGILIGVLYSCQDNLTEIKRENTAFLINHEEAIDKLRGKVEAFTQIAPTHLIKKEASSHGRPF